MDSTNPLVIMRADSLFTRVLVRALRTPYSFYYPFDSMQTATKMYPADSSFRIITWQVSVMADKPRQRGVIQMNTADGSLKIFPLYDGSDYTEAPNDSIRGPQNWIGAIYYKLIEKAWAGKKYYTLLGYDENGPASTKKWMDVLTFDETGQPRFGGDYFAIKSDSLFPKGSKRFNVEFKKEGRARFMYDEQEGFIVFDHLVSESNQPDRKSTFVPDGDYEAFKWENGKWVHYPKLFDFALEDGKEPRPDLLMDDNGGIDEAKLAERSEKNMKDVKPPKNPEKKKKKGTKPAGNDE